MTDEQWHAEAMRLAGYFVDVSVGRAPYDERNACRNALAAHLRGRPGDAAIMELKLARDYVAAEVALNKQQYGHQLMYRQQQAIDDLARIDALLADKEAT